MDLLNLRAKITLDSDEYEGGLSKLAGKAKHTFGTLSKLAKVGGAAIAAGGAAVVAVTRQAIDAYKEYEQLEGGIQTLYGENTAAAKAMMEQASDAWKTAGMSASEYMETAIESSAALINSLGGDTDRAAKLMDMSITDMSDNVNKMGTSMESIQNAYRGFSRGNFAMLDNLALGFAGTKDGMEQLLQKAEEYAAKNGEIRDFSIDSYADIVEAIHIVQDEMGIAGTTAEEAKNTISGSLNSMKSAWQNLLAGLADGNANIKSLIDNLVISIVGEDGEGGVINNILPAIQRALDGVANLITTAAPQIVPIIVNIIVDNLPAIISAGTQILSSLINGIVLALPALIAAIPDLIKTIVATLKDNWPAIKQAGADLLKMLWAGVESVWGWFSNLLSSNFSSIKDNLVKTWEQMKQDASRVWEDLKNSVMNIVDAIKGFLDFDFKFPRIPLPHFSVYPSGWRLSDLLQGVIPSLGIEWYKKAYNTPYMFTKPTVMAGFGDGVGGEMVYGRDNLMRDIDAVISRRYNEAENRPIIITVQSVLDGKVIGESVKRYERNLGRATG